MIYGAVAFLKSAFVLQLHEPVVSKPLVEHQKVKFKEMEHHREEGVRERVWRPGSLCKLPIQILECVRLSVLGHCYFQSSTLTEINRYSEKQ